MAETRTKTEAPSHSTHIVRNQSERRGPILAVAVHSTESADLPGTTDDLRSIRNWFDNPTSQASSHIGIDGQGNTELWVHSDRKAWTIGAANSFTVNIEFVARAAQGEAAWEEAQIKQGARWAAYWALKYDIPQHKGRVRDINGLCVCLDRGVIRHSDVTAAGFGTHTDPGPNFPMDDFLDAMRYYYAKGWTHARLHAASCVSSAEASNGGTNAYSTSATRSTAASS
jgi:N-acetyl-anhydromuramyl-L-alanine amidase AmpD